MTKAYYSVNGRILGEASGGTRLDYMTDALGSVTGTVDSSAQVVNTYRYKPYGELLAKTGSGSDPRFRWVGSPGYRQTGNRFSDVYVRARHYSSRTARWTSRDPDRGSRYRLPYLYGYANPAVVADPSGWRACAQQWPPGKECCEEAMKEARKTRCSFDGITFGTWEKCDLKDIPWDEEARGKVCTSEALKSLSCDELIRETRRVVGMCEGVCRAKVEGGKDKPDSYWAMAQVVCCSGSDLSLVLCDSICCSIGGKTFLDPEVFNPCLSWCALVHEKGHLSTCTFPPSIPPGVVNAVAWEECRQYAKHARCLLQIAIYEREDCLKIIHDDGLRPRLNRCIEQGRA